MTRRERIQRRSVRDWRGILSLSQTDLGEMLGRGQGWVSYGERHPQSAQGKELHKMVCDMVQRRFCIREELHVLKSSQRAVRNAVDRMPADARVTFDSAVHSLVWLHLDNMQIEAADAVGALLSEDRYDALLDRYFWDEKDEAA